MWRIYAWQCDKYLQGPSKKLFSNINSFPELMLSLLLLLFCSKIALFSVIYKDPEYWSGRGSNPRPPALQSDIKERGRNL